LLVPGGVSSVPGWRPGVRVERPEAEPRTYDLEAGTAARRMLVIAGTVCGCGFGAPGAVWLGGQSGCGHPFAWVLPRVPGGGMGRFTCGPAGSISAAFASSVWVVNMTCGGLAPVHGPDVSCRGGDRGGGIQGADVAVPHAVEDQCGQPAGGGDLGDVTRLAPASGDDALCGGPDR
jgi:hypothetical protein